MERGEEFISFSLHISSYLHLQHTFVVTIFYYSNNTEGHFNDPKGQQYSVWSRSILYIKIVVTVRNTVDRWVKTMTIWLWHKGHEINDKYDLVTVVTLGNTPSLPKPVWVKHTSTKVFLTTLFFLTCMRRSLWIMMILS